MESLFRFIVKYHLFLLFLVLEGLSVFFISHSSYFRHSAILAHTDAVKGSAKKVINTWQDYINLKSKNYDLLNLNISLLNDNIYLKNRLELAEHKTGSNLRVLQNFEYISAKVIENTLNKNDNRLILNAGKKNGVARDMGVISLDGVVGIVDRVTDNFCTVTSLLNTSRNINGKLAKTGLYGPLVWDMKDIRHIEMIDIPQHVTIQKGDTVVTSGHSLTFPEGILIGTVESYKLDKGVSYKIRIKLNNDFQSLYNVYIVGAGNKQELDSLKKEVDFER
jgi:rod shape-determining protein MreC